MITIRWHSDQYQWSFGTPGQTKVSGDRQRKTTHEVCCYTSHLHENRNSCPPNSACYIHTFWIKLWTSSEYQCSWILTRRDLIFKLMYASIGRVTLQCVFSARCIQKPRPFKFLQAFRHNVVRWCNENFDLVHFFQPTALYFDTSCDWLKDCRKSKFPSQQLTTVRRKERRKINGHSFRSIAAILGMRGKL